MNENREIRRRQILNKIERLQVELDYLDKLDEVEKKHNANLTEQSDQAEAEQK